MSLLGTRAALCSIKRLAAGLDPGRLLRTFSYRGVSPLIDGETLPVRARSEVTDAVRLSVISADGRETMTAQAEW